MLARSWIGIVFLSAAPFVAAEPEAPRDGEGRPLPKGAVARLGSMMLQHERPVLSAIFSHDGSEIISVGRDYQVRVWDAKTGKAKKAWPLAREGECGGLTLSRKGDLLRVAFTTGHVDVHELDTGKKRITLQADDARRPGLIPLLPAYVVADDEKTILTLSSNRAVRLLDLETGKELKKHQLPNVVFGQTPTLLMPDAKTFAYENPQRKELVFYDAESGMETKKLPLQENQEPFTPALHLRCSPDGKLLVVVKERGFAVWDLESGKRRFQKLQYNVGGNILFSPDNRWMVLAGYKSMQMVVSSLSGLEVCRLNAPIFKDHRVTRFSPNGRQLLLLNPQEPRIRAWDLDGEEERLSDEATRIDATRMEWMHDGRLVIWHNGVARVLEVPSGRVVEQQKVGSGFIVGSDGKRLLWSSSPGSVGSWVPGQQQRDLAFPLDVPAKGIAAPAPVVSPDGKLYAYLTERDTVLVRNLETGKDVAMSRTKPTNPSPFLPRPLAFTQDSRYLLGSADGAAWLHDVANGKARNVYTSEPQSYHSQAEMTLDGRCVLLGTSDHFLVEILDGWLRVRVQKQLDGTQPPPFPPSQPEVLSARTSPDGLLLARAGSDGSIRIFAMTAIPKATALLAAGQGRITALAFSRDGKRLASAGSNGTVLIWDVLPEWKEMQPRTALQKSELPLLWDGLLVRGQAYTEMRRLAADPKMSLPFLREKLKDRPEPDAKQIAQWIEIVVKSKKASAVDDLIEAGPPAQEEVSKALAKLEKDPTQQLIRQQLSRAASTENDVVSKRDLRRIRVIELLEWMGTPEARELIAPLTKGPEDSLVTRHARTALARMESAK